MTNYNELKNLKSSQPIELEYEKNKFRSHVFYDPQDFSYKFVKCRYENKNRIFNHVEICEFAFEDLPAKADEMIKQAIDRLHKTDDCWNIELISNDAYQAKKINCEKCKSLQ